jgi:2,5-diketo-D-gluconate reductase B
MDPGSKEFQRVKIIAANGLHMPQLGFGTWRISGRECQEAVESALSLGYRHIDTGQMYGNEAEVGAGVAASGVKRAEVHITTKVWNQNLAPERLRAAMAASLEMLRTDYVDLYLIHWPSPDMNLPAALETMMALQQEGKTHGIGVANFNVALLRQSIEQVRAPIAAVQFEYHVLLRQPPLLRYLREHGLPVIAYSPLAKGQLIDHPVLSEIARKHGAAPSQIALAWLLEQQDVAPIPKSVHRERQQENLGALKVTLDDADRAAIEALPKDQRCVSPGFAPAWDATG